MKSIELLGNVVAPAVKKYTEKKDVAGWIATSIACCHARFKVLALIEQAVAVYPERSRRITHLYVREFYWRISASSFI
jgi:hypothetical protein